MGLCRVIYIYDTFFMLIRFAKLLYSLGIRYFGRCRIFAIH